MKIHGDKLIFNVNDFAKEAPSFGYSRTLNKVIFKNKEAFWLCAVAAEQPHILDGVVFKTDDEFKKQVAKTIGKNQLTQKDIQNYLSSQLTEAMQIKDTLGDDSYKCFRVDSQDPNNISKMGAFESKKGGRQVNLGEDQIQ